MSTFLSLAAQPVLLYPLPTRTSTQQTALFNRTHFSGPSNVKTHFRGSLTVAQFGFLQSGQIPDPEGSEGLLWELFGRAEGLLYTIADAAVSNSVESVAGTEQKGDWLSGITNYMETVLKVLKDGLSTLHVPYAYGFAIILLTVLVKAATFPLTKKQVESAMAMRSLQPQIKAIQQRYAGDQERIQLETARLYKLAGINPLAGCLPTLATIPVWIGLYRALSNVANEGLLTEGFFWIPSLAGPTTIAARQNGTGISWIFPFVEGHPPLGWSDTLAYLVLPLLLIVSQYISILIMQSSQPNDPSLKSSQAITRFVPLMIGYFSLSVPSGLSLYWFTNNILSTAQQLWLQKLGGAKNPLQQINTDTFKEQQINTDMFKEQLQMQRSIAEIKSAQTEEKPTSTGIRRGERFKQLKEEEARRKRLIEEERKAQETVGNAVQIEEGSESKPDLVETGNGTGNQFDERREREEQATIASNPWDNESVLNGNASVLTSKEHQITPLMRNEINRPTDDNGNGRDHLLPEAHLDKMVDTQDDAASTRNKICKEETSSQT